MNKPLKMIQVGLGRWGWGWIPIVSESPQWELVGLVDIDKGKLNKACEHYNFESELTFSTLDSALKVVGADAALIVVPPEAHADITIDAIKKGLHCIVEKPIAPKIKDAQDMVECALGNQRKLMVSQNYRFRRAPRTVRHLLQRGVIGEVGTVYVNFQKAPSFSGFRTKMPEPLITDMAIHHFDQMRGILGLEPVRIMGYSWNPKWSWFTGNAVALVLIEMSNGAIINYTGSWVTRGWETTWDGDWHIQGDGGEIYWANNEIIIRPTDISKMVFTKGALEAHKEMRADLVKLPGEDREGVLFEFASAIRDDEEPETSGKDNIKSLAMVIGACMSIESNRSINIEEVINGD